MYLDIAASPNCPDGAMATFKEAGPARAVRALRLHLGGRWAWYAVTGWEDGRAVPARIAPIEESGDGPALVVAGGGEGLRLAPLGADGAAPAWDLADAAQHGEPFLICRPETEWR